MTKVIFHDKLGVVIYDGQEVAIFSGTFNLLRFKGQLTKLPEDRLEIETDKPLEEIVNELNEQIGSASFDELASFLSLMQGTRQSQPEFPSDKLKLDGLDL